MADVFEEQTEQTVSLNEYLDEVEDRELYHLTFWGTFLNDNMVIYIKEADLVLGGDDGKECTYNKGHMKRQAIFSCITCTPDGNAGVCTACSLSCHEDHEIIELWTKRNFKCDCGNSKFGAFYCKLLPSKDVENVDNSYNHNFKGQYCTCDRPYPDPNIQEQVEMIQCCICEDWFHEEHLGLESSNEIPRDEEGEPLYEELICQMCSKTCSFLYLYPPTILAPNKQNIDIGISKGKSVETSPLASGFFVNLENGSSSELDTIKDGPRDKGTSLGDKPKKCLLGDDLLATAVFMERTGPMFLSKNWREALCRCAKCSDFYAKKGVSFLLDQEDSIAEYEKMAKQKRDEKQQQEEGAKLNFLSDLGHVEKMEICLAIADMKDEMRSFLETFDSSKPITSDDIQQVFDKLKKRRRMD